MCERNPKCYRRAPWCESRKKNTPVERTRKNNKNPTNPGTTLDGLLYKPCPIYAILLNSCLSHNLRDWWVVRQVAKGGPALLVGTPSHVDQSSDEDEVMMIYDTFASNNQRKRALWEVNSIQQVKTQGAWVDTLIIFDHIDQSRSTTNRCPAALVLIPGREAHYSGKITLDVIFGTPANYCSEEVTFHIAPFKSGYHAFLGRDAFAKF